MSNKKADVHLRWSKKITMVCLFSFPPGIPRSDHPRSESDQIIPNQIMPNQIIPDQIRLPQIRSPQISSDYPRSNSIIPD